MRHKVLINGAGLGGLALACCLAEVQKQTGKKRFDIIIAERDTSISERPQGYSLRLQHNGFRTLQYIGLYEQMKAESSPTLRFLTLNSNGETIKLVSRENDPVPTFNLPRERVRTLLYEAATQKYDIPVLWGKCLTGFEPTAEGVQVLFSDNTSMDVDYLIGCDGARSRVKECLLGTDGLEYLGVASIVGVGNTGADFATNTNLQILDGATRLFSKPFDKKAFMWQMTWQTDLETVANMAAASKTNDRAEAVGAMLFEQGKRLTKHWKTRVAVDFLTTTNPTQVRLIPLYDSYNSTKQWKTGRVTLLGDSAHVMSPFKGQGANNALQDALELAEAMVFDSGQICISFGHYEEKMRKRSREHIGESRKAVKIYHTLAGLLPENIGDEL
jgi:salicylate hydroxylase